VSGRVLSPREADVAACLLDTVAGEGGGLPPASRTDARQAFDALLAGSPRWHRVALRVLLWGLELAALAGPQHRRMRRLDAAERQAYLERAAAGPVGPAVTGVLALARLAYYGDLTVMAALGCDPEAVVARGRALRDREARWCARGDPLARVPTARARAASTRM
jgi:hypothetical protein